MARRKRAQARFALNARPALALCIILGLLSLLAPAAADSAKRGETTSPEAGATTAPPQETAEESRVERALQRVERESKRAERAERKAAATQTTTSPTTAAPAPAARAGTDAGGKAERRAQRAAEREARHAARADPTTPTTGGGTAAAQGRVKAPTERQREERRREREERRRASGHETRKEKDQRSERELRETEEARLARPVTQPAAAAVASGASAGVPASTAAASPAVAAPTVASERAERTTARGGSRARRAPRAHAPGTAVHLAAAPATGATLAGSPVVIAHKPATGSGRASRHSRTHSASPLVTTVTRIIGVIPGVVWLLIGALALAALVFAVSSRVAAARARRLDRQRRDLLEDVGLLQAALLPELPERLGPVATSASYRPASGPGAGGDFYDVFALPEGLLAVIVGDVSGHGRDALPHTTLLRYTLRTYLEAGLGPREALKAAAPALERQLGDSFATVVLATYDPRTRLLTYACAGHPHPLLTGLAPDAAIIACSAPPIGAGRTGTRQTVVSVPGAAVAAFYTDGVIEARSGGELYGSGRLAGALDAIVSDPAASALLDRVAAETDRRPDDMAACLLEIAGGEARPRIVREEIELDGRESGQRRARTFLSAAGVADDDAERALARARAIAADHGSALLAIELDEGAPRLTLGYDNVAPLRARAMARTQEVAL